MPLNTAPDCQVCAHLSGLQFPDSSVTGPLQGSESTLQVSALPLRDGGVVHSLTDTAQGQTTHSYSAPVL